MLQKGSYFMTRILRNIFVSLICVVVAAPIAFSQKTETKFDESFNFSEHTNEVMDLKIVKAVNQILAAKGFVEVKEKPDFFLYYDGGGNTQIGAGGASQVGAGPTTSADVVPAYGMGNGPAMAPTTWLKVNGRIVFHMVDAASHKSVWETSYGKMFRDPDKALKNMDKEVNELVSKSFKDFPPKSKRA
jgi:hypothetical protein